MLTHIHIQNFTVIESLSLDFTTGFNVLTGETGAGKSIWVDAIGLALGGRSDANTIQPGKDRCDITLCFDIRANNQAKQWLGEHQLENEEECIIRRTIFQNNPSRSTINGTPSPQHLIRELAEILICIHSQHQHYTLLKREVQRERLDNFGSHNHFILEIQNIYQQWNTISLQLEKLKAKASERDSELTLLRYQLQEISDLNLQENESSELFKKHQQLHNAKDILLQLNEALEITTENDNVCANGLLNQAISCLDSISNKAPEIKSARELLNNAAIYLQEACHELAHYRKELDLNPENLAKIENRLNNIHDLARKHHVRPEQLLEVKNSLSQKINDLINIDIEIEKQSKEQTDLLKKYQTIAAELSLSRQKAAKKLSQTISKNMQMLGMDGGQFQVKLDPIEGLISPSGNEQVSFEVITNPGQNFQPLQKVVSGGELSRIGLALQVITAEKDKIPTIIFDEVDVGIGGKTAEIVGKLLRQLGEKVQVLCITHLPQVAALGHHHFKASKRFDKKRTHFEIKELDKEGRINELARMLGGAEITAQTTAHAIEILEKIA